MNYSILITPDAEDDLETIYDYIAHYDSHVSANRVLERLSEAIQKPEKFPQRGSYPKELIALGIREFRQIFFKPYRIIYRISNSDVIILLITDGRGDMQSLLMRRLLG